MSKTVTAVVWLTAVLVVAGCQPAPSGPQTEKINPLTQPLGDSVNSQTADTVRSAAAEPSPAAMEKLMPYLSEKVYSSSVPEIEMWPFRKCFARAIFTTWTPADRAGFEQIVASGRIYDDQVIIGLTRVIDRDIADRGIRAAAGRICPQYATAYASM